MARALASTDVWRVLMDATRESKVAYKAAVLMVLSAMASTRGDGDGTAADGGELDELDRLDRDTRLLRASGPRVAGPRLRSS